MLGAGLKDPRYQQLMLGSFMPELHILERKITEINRLPDQAKFKQQKQQESGVVSILKQTNESTLDKLES